MRLKHKVSLWLCACLAMIGCRGACLDFGPIQTPPPKVVWHDTAARLLLHRKIYPTFPDKTMDYRLTLHRGQQAYEVRRGRMQAKDFSWLFSATRLPDGLVAWRLRNELCTTDKSGRSRCGHLPSVGCPFRWMPDKEGPARHLIEAYRWLAKTPKRVDINIAAALALERLGYAKEALDAIKRIEHENISANHDLQGWKVGLFARITGKERWLTQLKARFAKGGFCRQSIVLASCVPELKGLLPAAIRAAHDRPKWQKYHRAAHQSCRRWPQPIRIWR